MLRRLALFVVLSVATTGCLDYMETIKVNRDGSVEISVYATVLDAALGMVKNRPELRGLLLLPISAGNARGALPPGVGIKHWQVESGPGIKVFDAAVTLPSFDHLSSELQSLLAGQNIQVFADDDGTIQYRREVPAYPIDDRMAFFGESLEKRLANSSLEFRLIVPTEIKETNGTRVSDHEVRWKTDLAVLRRQGILMVAKIEQPTVLDRYPWLAGGALGLAAVLIVGGLVRRRRKAG